jgi:hypothetical protein
VTAKNKMRTFATITLVKSLGNWADTERDKVSNTRGYGSDDQRTFKYRADLLDAAIHRLCELEACEQALDLALTAARISDEMVDQLRADFDAEPVITHVPRDPDRGGYG